MIVNVLLVVLILLRLVIGVRLFILARENNLSNIYWFAAQFFTLVLGLLFAPTAGNPLGDTLISLWLFSLFGTIVPQLCVIIFTHQTFYKDKNSPLTWFLAALAGAFLLSLYGILNSESNYQQSPVLAFTSLIVFAAWTWHAWSARRALVGISDGRVVEDWVKGRYQLMFAYSIALMVAPIGSFIRTFFAGGSAMTPLGNAMGILTLVAQIVAVILQFLAWVMPGFFRKWLNRNQELHAREHVQERAQAILDLFGDAMSRDTNLTRMLSVFALLKVISEELGTDDADKINQHVTQMSYDNWLDTLENPTLYRFISNSGPGVKAEQAVALGRHVLADNQSLFTMKAR